MVFRFSSKTKGRKIQLVQRARAFREKMVCTARTDSILLSPCALYLASGVSSKRARKTRFLLLKRLLLACTKVCSSRDKYNQSVLYSFSNIYSRPHNKPQRDVHIAAGKKYTQHLLFFQFLVRWRPFPFLYRTWPPSPVTRRNYCFVHSLFIFTFHFSKVLQF